MALVINEQLSNILRLQARVELGQISPQLAASQLGMTPEQLQSFQIDQGDSSLGSGDRGIGESLQDFEARRFGRQRFASQTGNAGERIPCGRPGQPPCFGTGQLESDNQLATVFDEVPDAVGSVTDPALTPPTQTPVPPGEVDPIPFTPQGPLPPGSGPPQLPLPTVGTGPLGFTPFSSRPDAGIGRRRLAGQLVRPASGSGGIAGQGRPRQPGHLRPRREAPADLVKKRFLTGGHR